MRKKRYTRRKRGVKRRTFKRYNKKRFIRKKRSFRRKGGKLNASLDQARFKIRVNRLLSQTDLGDDPQTLLLNNAADLTYTALVKNLPILGLYNQWRIDKVVTHWKMLNFNKEDYRSDTTTKGIVFSPPNNSTGADGEFDLIMFPTGSSGITYLNNLLVNYTQLRGVNYRRVSLFGGSRSVKPYVSEIIRTISKRTTNAPVEAQDIRRNYAKTFRYFDSTVAYEAPLYMIVPGMQKIIKDMTGTINAGVVDVEISAQQFPQIEVWSDVYVTAKQYSELALVSDPSRLLQKSKPMDAEAMTLEGDMNEVKDDVRKTIIDQITGGNPMLAAVAAVAGIRSKRPRDEIK